MTAPGLGAHLLVAGGAGFIGSCFVRDVLGRRDGTRVTVLDKLTYAGNRANLAPVEDDPAMAARFAFLQGDIADPAVVDPLVAAADAVVNFAAESHVDRSILDAAAFLRTGVDGVYVLLEAVRRESERAAAGERPAAPRLLQVSTDEVYGSVEAGRSVETDALAPRSPYAAAKAAGDLLVLAYHATYGLDVVITRGANTYGPYQHPEKLIPLFVTNAIDDLPLPLYGDGLQRRDWLHVADHAGAIAHVLAHGAPGAVYNVPGTAELANREIAERILDLLGKPWSLVRSVADRPGHDRRYALDGARLLALGWANRIGLDEGLAATVAWYREHESWWRAARGADWDAWYARQYGERLAGSVPAEAVEAEAHVGAAGANGRPAAGGTGRATDRNPGPRGLRCASPSPVPVAASGARSSPPSTRHRSRDRSGRSPGAAPTTTSTTPGPPPGWSVATGPTSSSMRRPGPTWTGAPGIRSEPCAATPSRSPSSPMPAPPRPPTSSSSPRTRSSTGTGPTGAATRRAIAPRRATRTGRASWPGRPPPRPPSSATAAS